MRDELRAALLRAMRARDGVRVAALRSVLAAVDDAEAVADADAPTTMSTHVAGSSGGLGSSEVARASLTEEGVGDVVRAEIAERRAVAADDERSGRADHAERLQAEADALETVLAEI